MTSSHKSLVTFHPLNWIISKSDKLSYHTNLQVLLAPIFTETKELCWLISDLEYNPDYQTGLPVDYEHEYFVLSPSEFQNLIASDVQIIWGVILGIPAGTIIKVDEYNLPFAEFNDLIWKNGNIQHPDAVIEIDCVDSSYTIVKFKDEHLSDKFKAYFPEAISLEKFKQQQ